MMKKIKSAAGFTLIEMMVVIAVIGILLAVLVASLGGSTDKARAVKCATNMKNLAAGISSAMLANSWGYCPAAQSCPSWKTDMSDASSRNSEGVSYDVCKAWISWLDQGAKYPMTTAPSSPHCSLASSNPEEIRYALTNGAIWRAVGCNPDVYVCPAFKEEVSKQGVKSPGWSYHMNAYFGYERAAGKAEVTTGEGFVRLSELRKADRRLLFAEIQGLSMASPKVKRAGVELPHVDYENTSNGNRDLDGCLWYRTKGGNESIGFNHIDGRTIFGHVVFADGHVEAIKVPKNANKETLIELTDWLCCGKDVTYHDGNYHKIDVQEAP